MSKISILLVDDHTILRDGLRALLSCYDDVQVVGEARNGAVALDQVAALYPQVVLMDIAMPVMDGLDATRLILRDYPQTRVLILTQYEDQEYVMPLLQAGAAGVVLKQAMGTDLINAIRAVARGETFVYAAGATPPAQIRHPARSGASEDLLTPREHQVLRHIVLGKTNAQIGVELSLSVKTVDWHRTNLMSKLGVHSVADLVRYALQHNLIEGL